MDDGFAVFDFGEVDFVVFYTNDVDFVEVGFVVAGDDGVAVIYEIISNERLGLFTFGGGVFVRLGFFCKTGEGLAGFKRFAMFGGEAVFVDGGEMRFGTIADMLVETVGGVFWCKVDHIVVTGDFGDDGGGGDSFKLCIGFDDGGDIGRELGIRKKIDFTVDNNLRKRRVKALN